ncbi:hypothetical protein CLOM_g2463 [Closterium sp. NIES-68]|nr:hypothetical protein CLOM_g2463 [Closterium sp. NIES-68]GJP74349.1 hypothetical protein CLOP_g4943 [Closterium sp. NIES-67]
MAEGKQAKVEAITLKVVAQDGTEVSFKVKPKTKFSKLFQAYSDRKGFKLDTMRFLYHGDRVLGDNTPAELGIEDNDHIEVMVEQLGGGRHSQQQYLVR